MKHNDSTLSIFTKFYDIRAQTSLLLLSNLENQKIPEIFSFTEMTTNNSLNSHLTSSSSILNDSVIQITTPVSTKLDRDNFLTWKSQIEPIINGFDLSHHIDDSSQPLTKSLVIGDVSQANPRFLSWQKQDQLLLKWLRSTISSPILSQYVGCKTAHHLWTSLHRVYSEVSSDRIIELPRSLQTETRGDQACTESGSPGRDCGSGLAGPLLPNPPTLCCPNTILYRSASSDKSYGVWESM